MIKQFYIFLFTCVTICCSHNAFAQPANDNCMNAEQLCPLAATGINGNTNNATSEICANCADGIVTNGRDCFDYIQTVWYTFRTNSAGGNVKVDVRSIACAAGSGVGVGGAIYEVATPCDESTYTKVSQCENNSTTGFTLNADALKANTTYYLQLNSGRNCGFLIDLYDPGVVPIKDSAYVSSPSTVACEGTPPVITANFQECNDASISWFVNGALTQAGGITFEPANLATGDEVHFTALCNCTGNLLTSDTLTFTAVMSTVNVSPDVKINLGQSTQLSANGGVRFNWTPAGSINSSSTPNPVATPAVTTTYVVEVTDVNNCVFKDSVTVTVSDTIIIPNTITPNGDGVNDDWVILNIDKFPSTDVKVYNRWGQIVFNTVGYTLQNKWDGTRNGTALPAGTYYYIIDINSDASDIRQVYNGSISIVY